MDFRPLQSNTMMLPTHVIIGLAIALPYAIVFPKFGAVALIAGVLGSIAPDLDLYAGHRRTLHYPVYYPFAALLMLPFAILTPTYPVVIGSFFMVAAAVHSVLDVYGGGLELRPWQATSERAVYDHFYGRWIPPRRWVRYDGAPEDFVLSSVLAIPLFLALDGILWWVLIAALIVGVVYTMVRRVLPTIAERLVTRVLIPTLPRTILTYLPVRYLEREPA